MQIKLNNSVMKGAPPPPKKGGVRIAPKITTTRVWINKDGQEVNPITKEVNKEDESLLHN